MKSILATALLFAAAWTSAAAQDLTYTIQPEGTPTTYALNCFVNINNQSYHFDGFNTEVVYSEDGKTIYIRSLFPYYYPDLWVKGKVEGNRITIDCNDVVATGTMDDEGYEYDVTLKVGEAIFNASGNPMPEDVRNIVLTIDGERIYVADDVYNYTPNYWPNRTYILYDTDGGFIDYFDAAFCYDMKPYTGPTDPVTLPATAEVLPYVYEYNDFNDRPSSDIARVAIDGDDYYFDNLVPDSEGWVKGTRQGNTITVARGQLMSFNPLILRFIGYHWDTGAFGDVTLKIDDNGVITSSDARMWCTNYAPTGRLQAYGRAFTITPYDQSAGVAPADPLEVHSVYYSELRQHGIEFYQLALSDDGKDINPDQLGYYIYVNGERFTFDRSIYPYIDEAQKTFIPYQYCDDYNLGDIFNDGNYNVVLFWFDDYETLGVQSIYRTSLGLEIGSNLIQVDKLNNTTVIPASQVSAVAPVLDTPLNATPSWYDLHGRRLDGPARHGVFLSQGRKFVVR